MLPIRRPKKRKEMNQIQQVQKIFAGYVEWHGSLRKMKRVIHFGLDALVSPVNAKKNAGTDTTSRYTIGVHTFITRILTLVSEI